MSANYPPEDPPAGGELVPTTLPTRTYKEKDWVTRTTTFQTRITAYPTDISVTIGYPWPPTTQPFSLSIVTETSRIFTTFSGATAFRSIGGPTWYGDLIYTTARPVRVMTDVEALIVDEKGKKLKLATLYQASQTASTLVIGTSTSIALPSGIIVPAIANCSNAEFDCWNLAQKIAVIVTVTVVGSGILYLIYLLFTKPSYRFHHNDDSTFCTIPSSNRLVNELVDGVQHHSNPSSSAGSEPTSIAPVLTRRESRLLFWRKEVVIDEEEAPINPELTRAASPPANYRRKHIRISRTEAQPVEIGMSDLPPAPVNGRPVFGPRSNTTTTIPKEQQGINRRDFAYPKDDIDKLVQRPAPVATTSTAEYYRTRDRSSFFEKDTKYDYHASVAEMNRELLKPEVENGDKYYEEKRKRRQSQRSRSEASEIYERRGDRLRRESPEARADERAGRLDAEAHRNKLRARRNTQPDVIAAAERSSGFPKTRRDADGRPLADGERGRARVGSESPDHSPSDHFFRFPPKTPTVRGEHFPSFDNKRSPSRGRTGKPREHERKHFNKATCRPAQAEDPRRPHDDSDSDYERDDSDRVYVGKGKVHVKNAPRSAQHGTTSHQRSTQSKTIATPHRKGHNRKNAQVDVGSQVRGYGDKPSRDGRSVSRGRKLSRKDYSVPESYRKSSLLKMLPSFQFSSDEPTERKGRRRSESFESIRGQKLYLKSTPERKNYPEFVDQQTNRPRRSSSYGPATVKFPTMGDSLYEMPKETKDAYYARKQHEDALAATGYIPHEAIPTGRSTKVVTPMSSVQNLHLDSNHSLHSKNSHPSPLRADPGPPPTVAAPAPVRRLSRKHVRIVHRSNTSDNLAIRGGGSVGLEGDNDNEVPVQHGRKESSQSRGNEDYMNDSETEAAWEQLMNIKK